MSPLIIVGLTLYLIFSCTLLTVLVKLIIKEEGQLALADFIIAILTAFIPPLSIIAILILTKTEDKIVLWKSKKKS